MKTNLHTTPVASFTSVNAQERKDLGIRSGDTVRVHQKIKETAKGGKGEKIRIQIFEGLVLATKHGSEPGATFTVRKVSNGVGIERIFPLYSPTIDKIEIVKRSKVRRSKLYHIREKVAREIKRQMRKTSILGMATLSDAEYQKQEQERMADEQAATEEETQVVEIPMEDSESAEASVEESPTTVEEQVGEEVADGGSQETVSREEETAEVKDESQNPTEEKRE